ncbi:Transcription inhibitor protein Gfh1 [Caulifigura coniformis]|uniref:Transcription inhibitor protein Gfh1 n=1 Tax=Caulifigura coniformis TaxID=2527983 RepID=A0A517S910_9PLAN|nr:GreA/GreB family elongation factor [Caulifigura coniformis]QDT52593.1 Transcription inhibitor protein Gfh1 [Caulifigura coniformis]
MNNRNGNPRPRTKASAPVKTEQVIGVGSRFSLRDLRTGELDVYTLVLPADADITIHQISSFAPLGRAVVGHKAGSVVEFDAPAGKVKVRIESVQEAQVADPSGHIP